MEDSNESIETIRKRREKMPAWLREWCEETTEILCERVDPETAQRAAFELAVREFKRREENKRKIAEVFQLVTEATDKFSITVGTESKFALDIEPTGADGIISITVTPIVDTP